MRGPATLACCLVLVRCGATFGDPPLAVPPPARTDRDPPRWGWTPPPPLHTDKT